MAPEKVIEKEKVVEKIVEVEVEKGTVRRNVETETVIIERPDGTKETIIRERDRSLEETERTARRDTDKEASKSKETTRSKKAWIATALVGVERDGLRFGLTPSQSTFVLQRRILGELYVGPYATLGGDFGLGVSMRF